VYRSWRYRCEQNAQPQRRQQNWIAVEQQHQISENYSQERTEQAASVWRELRPWHLSADSAEEQQQRRHRGAALLIDDFQEQNSKQ
jgi:hypothetical protein